MALLGMLVMARRAYLDLIFLMQWCHTFVENQHDAQHFHLPTLMGMNILSTRRALPAIRNGRVHSSSSKVPKTLELHLRLEQRAQNKRTRIKKNLLEGQRRQDFTHQARVGFLSNTPSTTETPPKECANQSKVYPKKEERKD